ncbi:MAG: hypothetical protein QGH33_18485, partial [Pirellulaceae bacterium]|nr:hypothetical protein [Pirellulaceae bacterium]
MTSDDSIEIDVSEYADVFDSSVQILREQVFVVDRQDYRFVIITTKPLAAPTILEPWHSTNRTFTQAVASTLNTHQRKVRITFEPADPSSQVQLASSRPNQPEQGQVYRFRVEVQIERRQIVTRHLSGSTAGNRVLKTLSTTP